MSIYREAMAYVIGHPADVQALHEFILQGERRRPSEQFSQEILPLVGSGYCAALYNAGKSRVVPQLEVVLRKNNPVVNQLDVCVCLHTWAEIGVADAMTFQRGELLIQDDVNAALEVFKKCCVDYGADFTQDLRLAAAIEAAHALEDEPESASALVSYAEARLLTGARVVHFGDSLDWLEPPGPARHPESGQGCV